MIFWNEMVSSLATVVALSCSCSGEVILLSFMSKVMRMIMVFLKWMW